MMLAIRRAVGEAASISHVIVCVVVLAACSSDADTPLSLERLQAGRTPPATTNVTTTVFDHDSAGNAFLTRSDDRTGAGFATYSAATSAKVISQITATGAWQLFLGGQTARQLFIALRSAGIPVLEDGYYSANVEAFSQCFADDNTTTTSLLAMSGGASNGNCSFGVDFSIGKSKYKLVMSPRYAGTGRARVTCVTASATACTSWTFTSDASAANAGVANLYRYANNGSLVLDGVYRNSYFVSAAQ